jgi:flagellar motor switch protein FliM
MGNILSQDEVDSLLSGISEGTVETSRTITSGNARAGYYQ